MFGSRPWHRTALVGDWLAGIINDCGETSSRGAGPCFSQRALRPPRNVYMRQQRPLRLDKPGVGSAQRFGDDDDAVMMTQS